MAKQVKTYMAPVLAVLLSGSALLGGAMTVAGVVPQTAQAATAGVVSNAEAAKRVESYFSGLTTLKANFTQQISGQAFAQEGTFTLKKPNQFVWAYETPDPQKVIATGKATYFVNEERNQVTRMPDNAGLARFFNAQKFSLAKAGAAVNSAKMVGNELVVVLKVDDKVRVNDQAGLRSVTLTFGADGNIRQFVAVDTTNTTTTVTLSNVQTGIAVPASVFAFTPPKA